MRVPIARIRYNGKNKSHSIRSIAPEARRRNSRESTWCPFHVSRERLLPGSCFPPCPPTSANDSSRDPARARIVFQCAFLGDLVLAHSTKRGIVGLGRVWKRPPS